MDLLHYVFAYFSSGLKRHEQKKIPQVVGFKIS